MPNRRSRLGKRFLKEKRQVLSFGCSDEGREGIILLEGKQVTITMLLDLFRKSRVEVRTNVLTHELNYLAG